MAFHCQVSTASPDIKVSSLIDMSQKQDIECNVEEDFPAVKSEARRYLQDLGTS